jgi:nitrite reductase (NO-forming)
VPPDAAPRVAVVHAQARRTLGLAVGFAAAAAVAIVVPHDTGLWLPLHLFLVGSLLLAISGATRLFVVTWSASEPASSGIVAVQRWLIAAGAAGLAVGREAGAPTAVLALSGLCVTAGLAVLGFLLVAEARTAKVQRFQPAVRYYLTAIAAGVVGTGLGAAMVTGRAGLRDAHLAVNLLGLVGLVIAGTLPFFVATQARTKMSSRATVGRLHANLVWLATSTTVAAIAAAVDGGHPGLVGVALAAYAAGLVHLATLLPRVGTKQLRWAGPRLVELGLGMCWWAGAVLAGAVRAFGGRDPFPERLVVALVVGGFVQILVASLAYLVPVLRGGGHQRLSTSFAATRSWTALVAANAAGLACLAGRPGTAAVALAVLAVDVVARRTYVIGGLRHV